MKTLFQAVVLTAITSAGVAHAANEIKLRAVATADFSAFKRVAATVRVKSLGANKVVFMDAQYGNVIKQIKFTYSGTAGDGYEHWRAMDDYCVVSNCGSNVKIKVGVETNGTIFYDDNNGANYVLSHDNGWRITDNVSVINVENPVLNTIPDSPQYGHTTGLVATKVNSNSSVTVHYTLDGTDWTAAPASAPAQQFIGERQLNVLNPNSNNVRVWQYSINLDGKNSFKYYFRYRVNGQDIIDNNFGQNYEHRFLTNYSSMMLRSSVDNWASQKPMALFYNKVWYQYLDATSGDASYKFFNRPWMEATNFGDNQIPADNIADLFGGSINIKKGYYFNVFDDRTGLYANHCIGGACSDNIDLFNHDNLKPTVIFIKKETVAGQDMFARGGIDWNYAKNNLQPSRDCSQDRWQCAIYMANANTAFNRDNNRVFDMHLDWYGTQAGQELSIKGSPLAWTTNVQQVTHNVKTHGYGYTPWNVWGPHYWMLYVKMDCRHAIPAPGQNPAQPTTRTWFEFKNFLTNYNINGGWERDIPSQNILYSSTYGSSTGTRLTPPYASKNHMGVCGKVNVFDWESGETKVYDVPATAP